MKIKFQVIPMKCKGRNLHSQGIISVDKWQEISRVIRDRSQRRCHCCERLYQMNELNAHEVWEFDESYEVQRLVDIIAVCDKCHMTIHYHYLYSNSKLSDREAFICKANYMEINHCGERSFESVMDEALKTYRVLNQENINWKLDISYAIKINLLEYDDINIDNLEKVAPGSSEFILPYRPRIKLFFNRIPDKCLIERMGECYKSTSSVQCQICGGNTQFWYSYFELRIKEDSAEMEYKGNKTICKLCRDTIFTGAHKRFMKHRKTTKHYLKVNKCSYQECIEHAKNARKSEKRRNLYIWLRTPELPNWADQARKEYLLKHGALLDEKSGKWYLYPKGNLDKFKPYL